MPTYIYAFTKRSPTLQNIWPLNGIDDSPLRTLTHEVSNVAALVSDVPRECIRPQRRHLAAHHQATTRIASITPALPTAFGLIAANDNEVIDLLEAHHDAIQEELARLAYRVEMIVRVDLEVPNIFNHLAETDPHLRAIRDRTIERGDRATHDDRVNAGRAVDTAYSHLRQQAADALEAAVAPNAVECMHADPKNDNTLATIACLIEREAQHEFEAAAECAATLFESNHTVHIAGPFPPNSFVTLKLDLDTAHA